jgi:hypothetical protein
VGQPAHQRIGLFIGLAVRAAFYIGSPVLLEAPVIDVHGWSKDLFIFCPPLWTVAAAHYKIVDLEKRVVANMKAVKMLYDARFAPKCVSRVPSPHILVIGDIAQIAAPIVKAL